MCKGDGFRHFKYYGKKVGNDAIECVSVFPQERIVYFQTGSSFRSAWGFVYDSDGRNPEVRNICCTASMAPGWSVFYHAMP